MSLTSQELGLGESGQAGAEIEVTPAMIEAGRWELVTYGLEQAAHDALITRAYRAMALAQYQGSEAQSDVGAGLGQQDTYS